MLTLLLSILETDEERNWFSQLYDCYAKDLYRIALSKLKNSADAEDAVQNAFLAAVRNASKICGWLPVEHPKVKAYIVIILESKVLDTFRYRKRHETNDFDALEIETLRTKQEYLGLYEALKGLSPRARHVLLLHYDMGFTPKEIAQQLGVSVWTVYKLREKAKRALERLLEAEDE